MMNQILESIDINAVIGVIVAAVIIPFITGLTNILRNYIATKQKELVSNQTNAACIYWIDFLAKLVDQTVVATNQTFVDALKKAGTFTEEKWNVAFEQTKTDIMSALPKHAIEILKSALGDLDVYINTLIQDSVNRNKKLSGTELELVTAEPVAQSPTVVINAANAEVIENKQ